MDKAKSLYNEGGYSQTEIYYEEKEEVRLNKYLTSSGFCSRRKADRLIEEKRVTIDGQTALLGSKVCKGQKVCVDGTLIKPQEEHIYIALNKPAGITCTTDSGIEGNIVEFMNFEKRIFPIGRLDKDSTGLILLTSDGDIVNKILRAENNHEKEYIVKVNKDITDEFIKKMASGVEITNMRSKTREITKPSVVNKIDSVSFSIILTQGLNRQIRRMCTELGYRVVELERIRIMNIHLGSLPTGYWRYLTSKELVYLNKNIN